MDPEKIAQMIMEKLQPVLTEHMKSLGGEKTAEQIAAEKKIEDDKIAAKKLEDDKIAAKKKLDDEAAAKLTESEKVVKSLETKVNTLIETISKMVADKKDIVTKEAMEILVKKSVAEIAKSIADEMKVTPKGQIEDEEVSAESIAAFAKGRTEKTDEAKDLDEPSGQFNGIGESLSKRQILARKKLDSHISHVIAKSGENRGMTNAAEEDDDE